MLYALQTRWNVALLQHPGLCESFPMLFLTTQHLSPLLVFGFTVERYISVCHPFQRERYCTTRRASLYLLSWVLLSVLLLCCMLPKATSGSPIGRLPRTCFLPIFIQFDRPVLLEVPNYQFLADNRIVNISSETSSTSGSFGKPLSLLRNRFRFKL